MIGAAATSLFVGLAFEVGAIIGVTTSRNHEDIEAPAKLHSLGKAFLLMGVVLIVFAIVGGEA